MAPTLSGIHHLKLPVRDLDEGIAWFADSLGARHVERFDHHDETGTRYAVIVQLPGLDVPVELREAPAAAAALDGYDPVTFGVADRAALDLWVEHLDARGVAHSPVISGFIGDLIELRTPDGLALRLYTDPAGGFDTVDLDPERAEISSPHVAHGTTDR
ncbi:VOC family protein [Brachybacterium kimchii]|uniref:VOC family protein n=1 Tax=Brachybacterium kimchii TaxID=2942909 RepID=A0ABY4NAC5_9MICO|nr:VOC family protein [Brachybacterium kimchii]UQN31491.1 VOC family protein [Brachybacterium kimchii]